MKALLRIVVSLSVAVGLLALLMVWGGVRPLDALARLAALPPGVYASALAVHFTIYLLRAWRFQVLVPRAHRPRYGRALVVSSAHNLASYVLPAKTGEASLVVYLKTYAAVPASAGLASLVVARLLDGAVLCALLAAACLALHVSGAYEGLPWLASVGVALAGGTAVLGLLSWRVDLLVRFVGWLVRRTRVTRWSAGERFVARIQSVAAALRTAGGGGKLLAAGAVSVPVWLGVFAFYAILARPMGLPDTVGFAEATFGSSLAMLSNLLPVNGLAGFGTQEAGWVVGFGALGVGRELALETGVGVHLVQLFNVCLMGVLAHLAMGIVPRLQVEDAPEPAGETPPLEP